MNGFISIILEKFIKNLKSAILHFDKDFRVNSFLFCAFPTVPTDSPPSFLENTGKVFLPPHVSTGESKKQMERSKVVKLS